MPPFSNPVRVTIFSAVVGLALIGALAMYFRRRKRRKANLYHEICVEQTPIQKQETGRQNYSENSIERLKKKPSRMTPNGDVSMASSQHSSRAGHGHSPASTIRRSMSSSSIKSEANSSSTVTGLSVTRSADLSPAQLLEVGMELVNRARSRWELAIQQIDDDEECDDHEVCSELRSQLQQLMELTDRMQNGYKSGFIDQICTSAALDAALDEMDREFEQQRRRNKYSVDDSSSDMDSFVSALDQMADLSDLEDHKETFQHLALYEAALLELTHGSVPCRILRTRMVNCLSDTEFLAKLHCIRLAFTEVFADEANRDWFVAIGRQLFSSLLVNAQRDADEFLPAYDALVEYINNKDNLSDMEEELRGRGVKLMTFYDIVIDFILFDAFDDLDSPPTSLTAVLQNRWLTSGFKEMALTTAVWSVLKAKRRMLKFPKGFIAHFYAISESVSPTLAWGFLGPDGTLKDLCNFFKNQVLCFMWEVFSFEKVRFTTVEELASDIMKLAKERAEIASERLS